MSPREHFYDGKDKGIMHGSIAIDLIRKRIDACDTLIECVKGDQPLHFQEKEPLIDKIHLLKRQLVVELEEANNKRWLQGRPNYND